MSQICEAYRLLTKNKNIHWDLKHQNILIKDGVIKIADFGAFKQNLNSQKNTCIESQYYVPL